MARSSPTLNAPDEPRPVPDGMSARLTISIPGLTPCISSAQRTIGCSTSSIDCARSSAEYLMKKSSVKVRLMPM